MAKTKAIREEHARKKVVRSNAPFLEIVSERGERLLMRRELKAAIIGEEFNFEKEKKELAAPRSIKKMRAAAAREATGREEANVQNEKTAMSAGPSTRAEKEKRKRQRKREKRLRAEMEGTEVVGNQLSRGDELVVDGSFPTSRFSGQHFNRSEWYMDSGFGPGAARDDICSTFNGEMGQSTEFATRTMTFENHPQVQGPVQDHNPTSQTQSPDRHNGE